MQNIPFIQFRQRWIKEADEFESIVKAQIQTLVRNLSGLPDKKAKCVAERIKETKPCDLFDSSFQSNNELSFLTDVNIDALLAAELERFELIDNQDLTYKRFGRLLISSFYGKLPDYHQLNSVE